MARRRLGGQARESYAANDLSAFLALADREWELDSTRIVEPGQKFTSAPELSLVDKARRRARRLALRRLGARPHAHPNR